MKAAVDISAAWSNSWALVQKNRPNNSEVSFLFIYVGNTESRGHLHAAHAVAVLLPCGGVLHASLPHDLYADAAVRLHLALSYAALCYHLGNAMLTFAALHPCKLLLGTHCEF